ncbi:hypothetical protein PV05_06539 [Exophiala xenobiotica]|uniref:Uncharacterized protein n=1 Tax=Exophiala xenobiotica TaxID=348802 RepID=A0A0D2F2J7_9EURO|nr:uncharacterized protein PV05_06539 [Exophiala xenobiotica]KIW54159.1 hypothetical protein PV05_06539 [Exophiala xenobiotica]
MDIAICEHEHRSPRKVKGHRVSRAPISEEDVESFLLDEAALVKVKFEEFLNTGDNSIGQTSNIAFAEPQLREHDDDYLNPSKHNQGPLPSEKFWKLRANVSNISAATPIYEEGCA